MEARQSSPNFEKVLPVWKHELAGETLRPLKGIQSAHSFIS